MLQTVDDGPRLFFVCWHTNEETAIQSFSPTTSAQQILSSASSAVDRWTFGFTDCCQSTESNLGAWKASTFCMGHRAAV